MASCKKNKKIIQKQKERKKNHESGSNSASKQNLMYLFSQRTSTIISGHCNSRVSIRVNNYWKAQFYKVQIWASIRTSFHLCSCWLVAWFTFAMNPALFRSIINVSYLISNVHWLLTKPTPRAKPCQGWCDWCCGRLWWNHTLLSWAQLLIQRTHTKCSWRIL